MNTRIKRNTTYIEENYWKTAAHKKEACEPYGKTKSSSVVLNFRKSFSFKDLWCSGWSSIPGTTRSSSKDSTGFLCAWNSPIDSTGSRFAPVIQLCRGVLGNPTYCRGSTAAFGGYGVVFGRPPGLKNYFFFFQIYKNNCKDTDLINNRLTMKIQKPVWRDMLASIDANKHNYMLFAVFQNCLEWSILS